jgi:F-box protein 11
VGVTVTSTVVAATGSVPAGFLSYAHVDDEYDWGGITEFRKALEGAVRLQTGRRDIRIFQDRDDVVWGQESTSGTLGV